MKKLLSLLFILSVTCVLSFAQNGESKKEETNSNAPPPQLSDEMHTWMIGEWAGTTESNMGTSKDWEKMEWGLGKQYVITHFSSQMTKLNTEFLKTQAEQMKMSEKDVEKMMLAMKYEAMGVMTLDPKTGEYVGHWFDNWRGDYNGKGTLEGKKISMKWDGTMGKEDRTMEFVGKDTMMQSFVEDMGGMKVEGKSTFTRKKK